jgi:predicted histidine transporter YuiF (NhaC family)
MNLRSKVPTYIFYPILATLIGLLLLIIPFIGVFLLLPLLSFVQLYDALIPGEFTETGHHVEVGFAWIGLKTWQAWLFYGSFFFQVGLLLGILVHFERNRRRTRTTLTQSIAQDQSRMKNQ